MVSLGRFLRAVSLCVPLSLFTVISQEQEKADQNVNTASLYPFLNVFFFVEDLSDWQLTEWHYCQGFESVVIKV